MNLRATLARTKARLRLPRAVGGQFRAFAAKQELAKPSRYYGDGGTIHGTTRLNVEVNSDGHVVAVWFRCQMLPFLERRVSDRRAREMDAVHSLPLLTGVEVRDLDKS